MAFITTNSINVFPSSYRKEVPYGKFTSEQNFVNILNSITDTDSYVVDYSDSTLKVVIHGYFFEIQNISLTDYPKCYLYIRVENGGNSLVNYSDGSTDLDNADTSKFEGIALFTDEQDVTSNDNYSYYHLQAINDGKIINKVRLSTDSIYYDSSTDLTTKIDSKQNKLEPVSPIEIDQDLNTISLNSDEVDKLDALENKGSNIKFVYFDKDGIAAASTANIGKKVTTTNYFCTKDVHLENGEVVEGVQRFFSTDAPDTSISANIGDMWFKYNKNS